MDNTASFEVYIASEKHFHLAQTICDEMEASAKVRGTGIAKREPSYIRTKMAEGKAVIAFAADGAWAGFCYIEAWSHGTFVANSGLIVAPAYRKGGLAKRIKGKIFELTREKYPDSKIFGLTTGLAVMKINSDLGYEPVTYSELTQDDEFWKGCQSCVNYDILMSKGRKNCLCTAMLYDPAEKAEKTTATDSQDTPGPSSDQDSNNSGWLRVQERYLRLKQFVFMKLLRKMDTPPSWRTVSLALFGNKVTISWKRAKG